MYEMNIIDASGKYDKTAWGNPPLELGNTVYIRRLRGKMLCQELVKITGSENDVIRLNIMDSVYDLGCLLLACDDEDKELVELTLDSIKRNLKKLGLEFTEQMKTEMEDDEFGFVDYDGNEIRKAIGICEV